MVKRGCGVESVVMRLVKSFNFYENFSFTTLTEFQKLSKFSVCAYSSL